MNSNWDSAVYLVISTLIEPKLSALTVGQRRRQTVTAVVNNSHGRLCLRRHGRAGDDDQQQATERPAQSFSSERRKHHVCVCDWCGCVLDRSEAGDRLSRRRRRRRRVVPITMGRMCAAQPARVGLNTACSCRIYLDIYCGYRCSIIVSLVWMRHLRKNRRRSLIIGAVVI